MLDPAKAKSMLDWEAQESLAEIVDALIHAPD
jgi:GDP-D-mannose dehydratase